MKIRVRFFRDAGAAPATGGLGIMDLVTPGDGTPKPVDITEEAQRQAAAATAEAEKNRNTNPDSGTDETEGLNEDGTLQEGYIKDAEGKVVKDPEYKPAEGTEDAEGEEEDDFWEAVDKITGRELKVEYPEGMDPVSPEGVAHRISAEREAAAEEFEGYLKQHDPRAYAYMLHRENGGTDADFFGDSTGAFKLPNKDELAASVDLQTQLYKYDLLSKGLDEDAAQALVDKAIKDNKLKERSDNSWTLIDKAQKDQLARLEKDKADSNKEFTDAVANITSTIEKQIKEGLGFIVPETKRGEFQKFVIDSLRFDNGKFYAVQEVGENPKAVLEALFFQHNKGDIKALVRRETKTQAAQSLRLKVKGTNPSPGKGGEGVTNTSKNLPLSAIL